MNQLNSKFSSVLEFSISSIFVGIDEWRETYVFDPAGDSQMIRHSI